jgi:NADH-quinone oxidoreductase subunit F
MSEGMISKLWEIEGIEKIDTYVANGGYSALKKALSMKPEEVVEEVKTSGIRGRGGAGFPAGVKWGFIPKDKKPVYLVCNADEGEPGTFKDRYIIEKVPHLLLEGIAISSYAVKANFALIYIRWEYVKGAEILKNAIREAREKGYLGKNILGSGFDLEIVVHRGAGAYICGEETALLESAEGKRGNPRVKPPFPASVGLYNSPTVINNVETLASIPFIIEKGGKWFASIGTPKSTGFKLFAVSGHVKKPGVYEKPMGYPLLKLINEDCGGIREGRKLKAVIPGGTSTPPLTAEEADVTLDFESLQQKGSMLGSGAIIVMDDSTCMVYVAKKLADFYSHESCGQCTPCREGMPWLREILTRIENGNGEEDDIPLLMDICNGIIGRTLCPLGDAGALPILNYVKKFQDEFLRHIKEKRCPFRVKE